jgi:hypothetical protein
MRTLLTAAFFAAFAGLVSADTVWLKNGGKLEGVTTSTEGDKLVVKMPGGTIRIDKDQVQKIVHRSTEMEEYELAAEKLKADDAKGHFELANWCAGKNLDHFEREQLEATVVADPEHKEARERLGYEKVGGKWLRGEELLKAKGMVKVDGKWMTKESAAASAAAKEKKRLEKELAEAQKKADREAEMSEADRLREFYESQDRVRRATDGDFDGRRSPRAYGGDYRDGYYGGDYFYAGTVGYYPYGYYPYGYGYSYGYPGYYGSSVGISYHSKHFSATFGSGYGYGYGYYPGSYGSGYYGGGYPGSSYGPVGPHGNSSGNFDRGGLAPGYGGYPR